MLLVTGFGTGFYLVRTYDLELRWLGPDASRWIVDSYSFFKEVYPLAAGIVVVSLFAYFMIASAVRRYKYYLDSGQDYRKMVSLAGSIDDLTNPAQIAKLSDYPDLQDILRTYGDQIREISSQMESREDDLRSVDLEMEIDSVLAGEPPQEGIVEGKWWAPVVRKVQRYVEQSAGSSMGNVDALEKVRRVMGSAALSYGRMMETVASAGQDVLEIVNAAGEYERLSGDSPSDAAVAQDSGPGREGAIGGIEQAAAKLSGNGQVMREISDENNGLALNLALMAARGEIGEHDLAQVAEKMRSSAERFGKVGKDLESVARTIAEYCGTARKSGAGGTGGAGAAAASSARKIEARGRDLQEKIARLGSDIDEIYRTMKDSLGGGAKPEGTGEEGSSFEDDDSLVNFGRDGAGSESGGDLVIDHGKIWEDGETYGFTEGDAGGLIIEDDSAVEKPAESDVEAAASAEDSGPSVKPSGGADEADPVVERTVPPVESGPEEECAIPRDGAGHEEERPLAAGGEAEEGVDGGAEEEIFEIPESAEIPGGAPHGPATDDAPGRGGTNGAEAPAAADLSAGAGEGGSGEWTAMPGHRWVDVQEQGKGADMTATVPEETAADSEAPRAEQSPDGMSGQAPEAGVEGDEPVYDLYALGAVEYSEEMETSPAR